MCQSPFQPLDCLISSLGSRVEVKHLARRVCAQMSRSSNVSDQVHHFPASSRAPTSFSQQNFATRPTPSWAQLLLASCLLCRARNCCALAFAAAKKRKDINKKKGTSLATGEEPKPTKKKRKKKYFFDF